MLRNSLARACASARVCRAAISSLRACSSCSRDSCCASRLAFKAVRLLRRRAWSSSSSKRPTRSWRLTSSISPSDRTLMRLPVSTVITTAVCRGRRPNRLNRALPTFEPRRSPSVESTPPRMRRLNSSSQPVTCFQPCGRPLKWCPSSPVERSAEPLGQGDGVKNGDLFAVDLH